MLLPLLLDTIQNSTINVSRSIGIKIPKHCFVGKHFPKIIDCKNNCCSLKNFIVNNITIHQKKYYGPTTNLGIYQIW